MATKQKPKTETGRLSKTRPMGENGKPAGGWKQCVKCAYWNKGARLKQCLSCAEPFPSPSSSTPSKSKGKAPKQSAIQTEPIIEWIKRAGGLAKCEAILIQVEEVEGVVGATECIEWIEAQGGLAKSKTILAHCEEVAKLGGVHSVRLLVSQWSAIRSLPE